MSNVVTEGTGAKSKSITLPRGTPITVDSEFSEAYMANRMNRLVKIQEKIDFEFTQDPALLQQYYQLREEMFISVWGLTHFSGVKDRFDEISQVMVARRGLHCIAGGRLTISTPSHRQLLPMEKDDLLLSKIFKEYDLENHSYGEFSRLAILPEFRAGVVFPEIARRFIRKAISEGVQYAFNIAPQPLARSYRQAVQLLGHQWHVRNDLEVPERDEYEGIKMVLSVMDLTRYAKPKPEKETITLELEMAD